MKVTELSAAHAGKTVRVWDQSGQIAGTLETVSFEWGEGGDDASWATGVGVTKAVLTISGWHATVTPMAQVEFLDRNAFAHEINDALGENFPNPAP